MKNNDAVMRLDIFIHSSIATLPPSTYQNRGLNRKIIEPNYHSHTLFSSYCNKPHTIDHSLDYYNLVMDKRLLLTCDHSSRQRQKAHLFPTPFAAAAKASEPTQAKRKGKNLILNVKQVSRIDLPLTNIQLIKGKIESNDGVCYQSLPDP